MDQKSELKHSKQNETFTKRSTGEEEQYTVLKSQRFKHIYLTHKMSVYIHLQYILNVLLSFVYIQFEVDEGNLQKREKHCIDSPEYAAHSKYVFTTVQLKSCKLSDIPLDFIVLTPNGSEKTKLPVIWTL